MSPGSQKGQLCTLGCISRHSTASWSREGIVHSALTGAASPRVLFGAPQGTKDIKLFEYPKEGYEDSEGSRGHGPVWSHESDLMILVGTFQLRIFYDYMF